MQLTFVNLLLMTVACCVYAEAQYYPVHPEQQPTYFRAGLPLPSYDTQNLQPGARFFTSLTVTISTTTTTTTVSTTYTCTTSTAAISYCTASGRRRRGILISQNKEGRALFYNNDEVEGEDGSIFLPSPIKEEPIPVDSEAKELSRDTRETVSNVPFVVQPGFEGSVGSHGRLLLSYKTLTITVTSTSSTTTALTAICSSTSGYPICASG